MLVVVDSDGSGEIDYDEFVSMARVGPAPLPAAAASDEPAGPTAPAVLRRKFRSVIHMLVLQRRIVDVFAKVNNAA